MNSTELSNGKVKVGAGHAFDGGAVRGGGGRRREEWVEARALLLVAKPQGQHDGGKSLHVVKEIERGTPNANRPVDISNGHHVPID